EPTEWRAELRGAPSPSPSPSSFTGLPDSQHATVGDADVTLYGAGRLSRDGERVVVEGPALVIDRPRGDAPLTIVYGRVTIRVQQATFALDRAAAPRVTVIRGELVLACPDREETVAAGETA